MYWNNFWRNPLTRQPMVHGDEIEVFLFWFLFFGFLFYSVILSFWFHFWDDIIVTRSEYCVRCGYGACDFNVGIEWRFYWKLKNWMLYWTRIIGSSHRVFGQCYENMIANLMVEVENVVFWRNWLKLVSFCGILVYGSYSGVYFTKF